MAREIEGKGPTSWGGGLSPPGAYLSGVADWGIEARGNLKSWAPGNDWQQEQESKRGTEASGLEMERAEPQYRCVSVFLCPPQTPSPSPSFSSPFLGVKPVSLEQPGQ